MKPAELTAGAPSNELLCPPSWVMRIIAGDDTSSPETGTRAQRELVARARRYVSSRPGERIRLAEIGRALGVSPAYVTEVFRKVDGIPLYRYVLRKRLESAIRLLPDYGLDLSALALQLGFSSHSHFTTAFVQTFGCTPAFFRERARALCPNLRARTRCAA